MKGVTEQVERSNKRHNDDTSVSTTQKFFKRELSGRRHQKWKGKSWL
jgi:hypothetical protein